MKNLIKLCLLFILFGFVFTSCKTEKAKAIELIKTTSHDFNVVPNYVFENDLIKVKDDNGEITDYEMEYILEFEDGTKYKQKAVLDKDLTKVTDYYIVELLN